MAQNAGLASGIPTYSTGIFDPNMHSARLQENFSRLEENRNRVAIIGFRKEIAQENKAIRSQLAHTSEFLNSLNNTFFNPQKTEVFAFDNAAIYDTSRSGDRNSQSNALKIAQENKYTNQDLTLQLAGLRFQINIVAKTLQGIVEADKNTSLTQHRELQNENTNLQNTKFDVNEGLQNLIPKLPKKQNDHSPAPRLSGSVQLNGRGDTSPATNLSSSQPYLGRF